MTSGIAAVMTLPCSGLPEKSLDRRAALYSPLSFLLIPETAASVKGENAVFRKNPTVKRPIGKIRRFSRLANYKYFSAENGQSATTTTAASGGNREELLGQRPARRKCRPRHDADAGCRNPIAETI